MSVNLSFRDSTGRFSSHKIILGAAAIWAIKVVGAVAVSKVSESVFEKMSEYIAVKRAREQNQQSKKRAA